MVLSTKSTEKGNFAATKMSAIIDYDLNYLPSNSYVLEKVINDNDYYSDSQANNFDMDLQLKTELTMEHLFFPKKTDSNCITSYSSTFQDENLVIDDKDDKRLTGNSCSVESSSVSNVAVRDESVRFGLGLTLRGKLVENETSTIFEEADYFSENYTYKLLPVTIIKKGKKEEGKIYLEHNYCQFSVNSDSGADDNFNFSRTIDCQSVKDKCYRNGKRQTTQEQQSDSVCVINGGITIPENQSLVIPLVTSENRLVAYSLAEASNEEIDVTTDQLPNHHPDSRVDLHEVDDSFTEEPTREIGTEELIQRIQYQANTLTDYVQESSAADDSLTEASSTEISDSLVDLHAANYSLTEKPKEDCTKDQFPDYVPESSAAVNSSTEETNKKVHAGIQDLVAADDSSTETSNLTKAMDYSKNPIPESVQKSSAAANSSIKASSNLADYYTKDPDCVWESQVNLHTTDNSMTEEIGYTKCPAHFYNPDSQLCLYETDSQDSTESTCSVQPLDLTVPSVKNKKTEDSSVILPNSMDSSDNNLIGCNIINEMALPTTGIEVTLHQYGNDNYYPHPLFLKDVRQIVPDLIDNGRIDIFDCTTGEFNPNEKRMYYVISEENWDLFETTSSRLVLTNDETLTQKDDGKSEKARYLFFDFAILTEALQEYCDRLKGIFNYIDIGDQVSLREPEIPRIENSTSGIINSGRLKNLLSNIKAFGLFNKPVPAFSQPGGSGQLEMFNSQNLVEENQPSNFTLDELQMTMMIEDFKESLSNLSVPLINRPISEIGKERDRKWCSGEKRKVSSVNSNKLKAKKCKVDKKSKSRQNKEDSDYIPPGEYIPKKKSTARRKRKSIKESQKNSINSSMCKKQNKKAVKRKVKFDTDHTEVAIIKKCDNTNNVLKGKAKPFVLVNKINVEDDPVLEKLKILKAEKAMYEIAQEVKSEDNDYQMKDIEGIDEIVTETNILTISNDTDVQNEKSASSPKETVVDGDKFDKENAKTKEQPAIVNNRTEIAVQADEADLGGSSDDEVTVIQKKQPNRKSSRCKISGLGDHKSSFSDKSNADNLTDSEKLMKKLEGVIVTKRITRRSSKEFQEVDLCVKYGSEQDGVGQKLEIRNKETVKEERDEKETAVIRTSPRKIKKETVVGKMRQSDSSLRKEKNWRSLISNKEIEKLMSDEVIPMKLSIKLRRISLDELEMPRVTRSSLKMVPISAQQVTIKRESGQWKKLGRTRNSVDNSEQIPVSKQHSAVEGKSNQCKKLEKFSVNNLGKIPISKHVAVEGTPNQCRKMGKPRRSISQTEAVESSSYETETKCKGIENGLIKIIHNSTEKNIPEKISSGTKNFPGFKANKDVIDIELLNSQKFEFRKTRSLSAAEREIFKESTETPKTKGTSKSKQKTRKSNKNTSSNSSNLDLSQTEIRVGVVETIAERIKNRRSSVENDLNLLFLNEKANKKQKKKKCN